MATNRAAISRAEPGAERKRTRLKAPATATPVPTFPLTIMMTTQTTAGRTARVTTRLRLNRERHMVMPHSSSPSSRDTPTQSRKSPGAMVSVSVVSNNPRNRVSGISHFSSPALAQDIRIGCAVFGKGRFEKVLLRQNTGHPKRQSAGHLDFHQHLIRRKDGDARRVGIQRQLVPAVADFRSKVTRNSSSATRGRNPAHS